MSYTFFSCRNLFGRAGSFHIFSFMRCSSGEGPDSIRLDSSGTFWGTGFPQRCSRSDGWANTGKFQYMMNNVAGLWPREDPPRWLARSACAIAAHNCQFSNKECASISPIFTNFRRNLPVFKKGVRLNFTDFHQFSSKLANFQKRSAPQFHRFSQIFVETCQFSNKECASVSLIFTNFRRKLPVFK